MRRVHEGDTVFSSKIDFSFIKIRFLTSDRVTLMKKYQRKYTEGLGSNDLFGFLHVRSSTESVDLKVLGMNKIFK